MDETTRTFRLPVGAARSLLSATDPPARWPVEGRPPHPQRHLLATEYGRPLARPARPLRQVEDGPRPLRQDAQERPARPHPGSAATPPGPARPDRLRPLVRRWLFHPRQSGRGRRLLEKKVDGEPADHALGRSRGGFG